MQTLLQDSTEIIWNRLLYIGTTIWNKLYGKPKLLAITYPKQFEEKMPRTRRRHISRDRTSASHRDKRRRVDSEEQKPAEPEPVLASPPYSKRTRSGAKRHHHESAASSLVSKESS